jgi:hypothetical protein
MIDDHALRAVIVAFPQVLVGWAAMHIPGEAGEFGCLPGSMAVH